VVLATDRRGLAAQIGVGKKAQRSFRQRESEESAGKRKDQGCGAGRALQIFEGFVCRDGCS
jgi:hypothetical protein